MKDHQHTKVLIVDDQSRNLDALEAMLESSDCELVRASSADETLLSLLRDDFAAIVLDVQMPDMNGFEFAETIRADNNLSTMPIIALSSLTSPAAIERGRQAGFHDYVAKFDRPGLIAALKEQTAETRNAA